MTTSSAPDNRGSRYSAAAGIVEIATDHLPFPAISAGGLRAAGWQSGKPRGQSAASEMMRRDPQAFRARCRSPITIETYSLAASHSFASISSGRNAAAPTKPNKSKETRNVPSGGSSRTSGSSWERRLALRLRLPLAAVTRGALIPRWASEEKEPGFFASLWNDTRTRNSEQNLRFARCMSCATRHLSPRAEFGPSPSILSLTGRGEDQNRGSSPFGCARGFGW